MKRTTQRFRNVVLFATASLLPVVLTHEAPEALEAPEAAAVYRLVPGWGTMPEGAAWGQVPGMAIDANGKIYAFHRAEPPIVEIDPGGRILKRWGEGMFVWPHGIRVDRDGFLWLTDGRARDGKGQQVFKMTPDGKVVMTLGTKGVAGDGPETFNGVCDVAIGRNGDIFVADGHVNARVVKFSKDGKFIKAWGSKGTGHGQFDLPHAIVIDRRGRVLVADRSNNRIQIFDQDASAPIDHDRVRQIELSVPRAFRAPRLDELPVLRELDDARVDVAVGHEDVAVAAEGDIAHAIECLGPITRDAFGAERHHHVAVGRHLEDLLSLAVARAPVGHPEEPVLIHADAVRPDEHPVAPSLENRPRGIDLDDGRLSAMEGVDLAVGVDRHPWHLPPRRAFRHRAPAGHETVGWLRLERCNWRERDDGEKHEATQPGGKTLHAPHRNRAEAASETATRHGGRMMPR